MDMDRQGRVKLHDDALAGNVDGLRRLLDQRADPDFADEQGLVALHFAAQEFHPEVVGLLLERGASVDPRNSFGNTPLWTAVFNSRGRDELIALLRDSGADPFCANESGRTPFDLASLIGNPDVAQFFDDLRG